MCGIVAFTGSGPVLDAVVSGLRRLEYRGYDSAGVAAVTSSGLAVSKRAGRIDDLEPHLTGELRGASAAIGHTRWATHGEPTSANAHPHTDCAGRVAIVHNGIIENHNCLRAKLRAEGHAFTSQTDSEVVAHLIEQFGADDLERAVARALSLVHGSFAVAAVSVADPGLVVVARRESPLLISRGEGVACAASDVTGLGAHFPRVWALEDGTVAALHEGGFALSGIRGRRGRAEEIHVDWDPGVAERGGFETFMRKEIEDQPRALDDTLRGRGELGGLEGIEAVDLASTPAVTLIGCGSSAHACMIGEQLFETYAGVRATTELASEFRSRRIPFRRGELAILLSQSGETADTVAAARIARDQGAAVLAVTNTQGSRLAREADAVMFTRAGPEVSVAATKTFTVQVAALARLALEAGFLRARADRSVLACAMADLRRAGRVVEDVLERAHEVELWRDAFRGEAAMLIGRGVGYPVALEGALKLKEIAYLHAHGYAAGEMKHGPIALIERGTPVLATVPDGPPGQKTLANLEEVRARGARTLVVAAARRTEAGGEVFAIDAGPVTFPIGAVVPAQLVAHSVARDRGIDLDRPRNLAKSVTVE